MAKKPSSTESPRRVKEFVEIAAKDRNNANSLRRLLYDVIVRDFQSSTRDAAARFKQLLLDSRERRRFRTHGKGLTATTVGRVLNDDNQISYSQLDAVAQHSELPMGLVMLFSRVRSEVESARGDIQEARRVLISAKVALNQLENSLGSGEARIEHVYEHLSHDAFERMRDAYLAKLRELKEETLL